MSKVTTASELAKFLAAEYPDRGATLAMKVVYYVQGWHLAWEGTPAFHDRVEAWDLGPVAPAAYTAYDTYQLVVPRPTWSMPEEITAIEESEMRTYFTQHAALAEEKPTRPAATSGADRWDFDVDELDQFTASSAKRWADALDLLSR